MSAVGPNHCSNCFMKLVATPRGTRSCPNCKQVAEATDQLARTKLAQTAPSLQAPAPEAMQSAPTSEPFALWKALHAQSRTEEDEEWVQRPTNLSFKAGLLVPPKSDFKAGLEAARKEIEEEKKLAERQKPTNPYPTNSFLAPTAPTIIAQTAAPAVMAPAPAQSSSPPAPRLATNQPPWAPKERVPGPRLEWNGTIEKQTVEYDADQVAERLIKERKLQKYQAVVLPSKRPGISYTYFIGNSSDIMHVVTAKEQKPSDGDPYFFVTQGKTSAAPIANEKIRFSYPTLNALIEDYSRFSGWQQTVHLKATVPLSGGPWKYSQRLRLDQISYKTDLSQVDSHLSAFDCFFGPHPTEDLDPKKEMRFSLYYRKDYNNNYYRDYLAVQFNNDGFPSLVRIYNQKDEETGWMAIEPYDKKPNQTKAELAATLKERLEEIIKTPRFMEPDIYKKP